MASNIQVSSFQHYISDAGRQGCKLYRKDIIEKTSTTCGVHTIKGRNQDTKGNNYQLWTPDFKRQKLAEAEPIFNRGVLYVRAFLVAVAVGTLGVMFLVAATPLSTGLIITASVTLGLVGVAIVGLFIAIVYQNRKISRYKYYFGIQQALQAQKVLKDHFPNVLQAKYESFKKYVADQFEKHPSDKALENINAWVEKNPI